MALHSQHHLEAISKIFFEPTSLLVLRIKSFDPPQVDLRLVTQRKGLDRWGIRQRGEIRPHCDFDYPIEVVSKSRITFADPAELNRDFTPDNYCSMGWTTAAEAVQRCLRENRLDGNLLAPIHKSVK